jgi:Rps23 Pro-64 3,4-dihydroxylase Tpa1-like proline 4-hydroxylase
MGGRRPINNMVLARHHDAAAYARVYRKQGRIALFDLLEDPSARTAMRTAQAARFSLSDGEKRQQPYLFETAIASESVASLRSFFTGPAFLAFASAILATPVTGANVDLQRFRPGDYQSLTRGTQDGVAGFALHLTRHWSPAWGGLLLFTDGEGNIAEGHTPQFNRFSLYRLPQDHFISQVSQDATEIWLAISGVLLAAPAE